MALLYDRFDECMTYEANEKERCRPLLEKFRENETNWFIKCVTDLFLTLFKFDLHSYFT